MTKVSVLMATFGRDRTLAEALSSLSRQSFSDWEAVVVDNGRSASTRRVVEGFRESRFRYFEAPRNLGEGGGRNLALRASKGELVCYLDDDDLLPESSLRSRVEVLDRSPSTGVVYAGYRRTEAGAGERKAPVPVFFRKEHYDALLRRVDFEPVLVLRFLKLFNFVRGGTPLMRREALESVGGFDEGMTLYADYDLWLKLAARFRFAFLDETVYLYRVHPGSVSVRMRGTAEERRDVLTLASRHRIEQSLQFPEFQTEIARLWTAREGGPHDP